MQFHFNNVNDAFYGLVDFIYNTEIFQRATAVTESRNGPVLQFPEPVMIAYSKPWQRVLFDKNRNANPFFHLYEALWMLAGKNTVSGPAYYVANLMAYSDDGVTLNGAYGYRWRKRGGCDQLDIVIEHLRNNPDSRRAVIQMWAIKRDLWRIDNQFAKRYTDTHELGFSKDVCCNLSVCVAIREEIPPMFSDRFERGSTKDKFLDITVFNRSNDTIWGALGANYVHFGFLQQYLADCLGVQVGRYYQISNNLHVYLSNWHPEKWLEESGHSKCYPSLVGVVPLVQDKARFDKEVVHFVDSFDSSPPVQNVEYREPWLQEIARPMCMAFYYHKQRKYDQAFVSISQVQSPDWKRAGTEWLERRREAYKAKG